MTETPREHSMVWWFLRTYGVRIVIGAVLVAALYGVLCVYMPYQREQRMAREIESAGGHVEFEFDGPNWIPMLVQNRLPIWNRITTVGLRNTQVTDAGLLHLTGVTKLNVLDLDNTQVTDAGLSHLKGLTKLEWLYLHNTQVTDAGLLHLKGLTKLLSVSLKNTHTTVEGRESLLRNYDMTPVP